MAKNITKRDLVLDIADGSDVPREKIQEIVESFLTFVKFHIAKGQTIEIRGFGTFSLQHRKRRPARNIHTGAVVPLAERYVPTLKFCDAFRKRVTMVEVLPEE
jgi:nucleoid DNA-binding protein